jgi:hypothetical protein
MTKEIISAVSTSFGFDNTRVEWEVSDHTDFDLWEQNVIIVPMADDPGDEVKNYYTLDEAEQLAENLKAACSAARSHRQWLIDTDQLVYPDGDEVGE